MGEEYTPNDETLLATTCPHKLLHVRFLIGPLSSIVELNA